MMTFRGFAVALSLKLSASSGADSDSDDATEAGRRRLAVDAGSQVTLTATLVGAPPVGSAASLSDSWWSFGPDGRAPTRQSQHDGSVEITFTASPTTYGIYQMTATSAEGEVVSNQLAVVSPRSEDGEGDGDDHEKNGEPVEVAVGEWDGVFAYVSLAVLALFGAATIALVYSALVRVVLPDEATSFVSSPAQVYVDGRWASRIEAIVLLVTMAIAVILLCFGTWLAALEVRGRLRRISAAGGAVVAGRGISGAMTAEAVTALTGLVKEFRQLRGTIMVLVVGGVLLVGCLVLALQATATDRPPTPPAPSPSATATPTPAPSPSLESEGVG